MKHFCHFLIEEDGAITIEWVALAAGVILLALGVISVIEPSLDNAARTITSDIEDVVQSQVSN